MGEGKTSLNMNRFQPFHPCLVGLQSLPRDVLPVSGKLALLVIFLSASQSNHSTYHRADHEADKGKGV